MERMESFDIAAPNISIENACGSVILLPSNSSETKIHLEGRAKSEIRIIEDARIELIGNKIVVSCIQNKKGFGFAKDKGFTFEIGISDVRITITHPADAWVSVKTISSEVSSTGDADHMGVSSVSGVVRVKGKYTSLDIKTVSGAIDVAQTPIHHCKIKTVSGSVRLNGTNGCNVEAKTVSGDVTVYIEPNIELDIDAQSLSGKLSSAIDLDTETPDSSGSHELFRLQSKSLSGDIVIQRAEKANSK
jgi:hypothetical protein